MIEIRRVDFGSFVRPPAETGTATALRVPLYGYVVIHPTGSILFDTGMGVPDDETELFYRPSRIPLVDALAAVDMTLQDVTLVANCHLHFDHCGGNPSFAGRPIVCQRVELSDARVLHDYSLPELVDPAGVRYLELDGEAELAPGVHVWPTPGHTGGHQSLVVRLDDGTVVLAGQTHSSAAEFGVDAAAGGPAWLDGLLALDPRRVLFAHDGTVWEP
jgi:N-acyl homoserine lactone hydrolase